MLSFQVDSGSNMITQQAEIESTEEDQEPLAESEDSDSGSESETE